MDINSINPAPSLCAKIQNSLMALVDSSDSVDTLISSAIDNPAIKIELFQGMDDEDPAHELVGIKLAHSKTDFIDVYLEKSEFSHPKTQNLSKFINRIAPRGQIDLDNEALDAWEDDLGFVFSPALCTSVGTKDVLWPYIYTFVCSDGGEASLSRSNIFDDDDYEDMREELEAEGLSRHNLVLLNVHYWTPQIIHGTQPGFGSHRYIRWD